MYFFRDVLGLYPITKDVLYRRTTDLGLNKGLHNPEAVRHRLITATDRFLGFEDESRNVHVDFPLFQRLALPIRTESFVYPPIRLTLTSAHFPLFDSLRRALQAIFASSPCTGSEREIAARQPNLCLLR